MVTAESLKTTKNATNTELLRGPIHEDAILAQQWVDAGGDRVLLESLPLTPEDLQSIGMLVQLMALVDTYARRALELFGLAEGLETPSVRNTLRDNQVCATLRSRLDRAPVEASDKLDAETYLEFFEGVAWYRHIVAHWPGRRSPIGDCLVFVTKNNREASRKSGAELGAYELRTAVVYSPQLRGMINDTRRHVDEFGKLIEHWADQLDHQNLLPPLLHP
jgi:hypothetical protein